MHCDNCGCKLEQGVRICPVCGKQFPENETAPEVKEQQSQNLDVKAEPDNEEEEGTTVLSGVLKAPEAPVASETPEAIEDNEEEEGTTVLINNPNLGLGDEKTVSLNPETPIFNTGNLPPNGIPPMGQNGMPPMGPNGMPPMGQNGMPPIGSNGVSPMGPNGAPNHGKPQKTKKPKKKKSAGKLAAIIGIPAVIIIAAGVAAAIFVPKFLNYNKAQEKLEAGEIDEAMDLFTDLGSFKDAETMVNGGAYYEYATALMEDEDYSQAAEYFEKAAESSYEDAAEKAKECYFSYGEELLSNSEYEDAVVAFEKAGDYLFAVDKIKECYYQEGKSYMEQEAYDKAIDCFTEAGDFQDSNDLMAQCYYYKAEALADQGNYTEAYDYYIESEYSDYLDKANACIYNYAVDCFDNGDYEEAIENFSQVDSSYADCTSEIDTCYIYMAYEYENDGDYVSAIECYNYVTTVDVGPYIRYDKACYIEDHYTSSDPLTMEYVCDLKYLNYGTAIDDYVELCGWQVVSFVNHDEEDYDNLLDSIDMDSDVYVHTIFENENDSEETLNLNGYIVYSDGTKSNEITFGTIYTLYGIWFVIEPDTAISGETSVYIYDVDSDILIEKYTFILE